MAFERQPSYQEPQAVGFGGMMKNRLDTMTLTQFIVESTSGDQQLALLMNAVQHACKACGKHACCAAKPASDTA